MRLSGKFLLRSLYCPKKVEDMGDKRIYDLTKIESAPGNGVLPIDVPGSEETNGITIDALTKKFTAFGLLSFPKNANDLVKSGYAENVLGNYPDWKEYQNYPTGYGMFIVFSGISFVSQFSCEPGGYIKYRFRSDNLIWTPWKSLSFI